MRPNKSCGASASIPALAAAVLTTSQMTFGVTPSPQTRPVRWIARKPLPLVIPPALVQSSTAPFTHVGIGTVRTWPAFPWEVRDDPVFFS